jgi:predicted kinase
VAHRVRHTAFAQGSPRAAAYKLKKAVDLGFLDFTTREKRKRLCKREVALNRRLAPDVYLGVADVLDPSGEACDHMVGMRRMPTERRLSTLVPDSTPVEGILDQLGRLIADFHARAERSVAADRAAGAEALAARWAANTDQPAAAPYGEGIYAAPWIDAADQELLYHARLALHHGETVVLDASWSDESHRVDARRVAAETVSDLVELRCVAPAEVVVARLAEPAAASDDASDADRDIGHAMSAVAHPWPTSVTIDTAADRTRVLVAALGHLAADRAAAGQDAQTLDTAPPSQSRTHRTR